MKNLFYSACCIFLLFSCSDSDPVVPKPGKAPEVVEESDSTKEAGPVKCDNLTAEDFAGKTYSSPDPCGENWYGCGETIVFESDTSAGYYYTDMGFTGSYEVKEGKIYFHSQNSADEVFETECDSVLVNIKTDNRLKIKE